GGARAQGREALPPVPLACRERALAGSRQSHDGGGGRQGRSGAGVHRGASARASAHRRARRPPPGARRRARARRAPGARPRHRAAARANDAARTLARHRGLAGGAPAGTPGRARRHRARARAVRRARSRRAARPHRNRERGAVTAPPPDERLLALEGARFALPDGTQLPPMSVGASGRLAVLVGAFGFLFRALIGALRLLGGSATVFGTPIDRAIGAGVAGLALAEPPLPPGFTLERYLRESAELLGMGTRAARRAAGDLLAR